MKICAISDTHNRHQELVIPECDILIHAGDFTNKGTFSETESFISWLSKQDQAKYKVFISGNHDFLAQKEPYFFKSLISEKVIYLQDSSIEINGIKFYGTPWTPFFYDWAFNGLEEKPEVKYNYKGGPGNSARVDSYHKSLDIVYGMIPDDTDILICHGPPRIGNLDKCEPKPSGSLELRKRLLQLNKLQVGIFGHFHSGYGIDTSIPGKRLYNVASCDEEYRLHNPIMEIEI